MKLNLPVDGGWVPYSQRTKANQRITDAFHERIGRFSLLAGEVGDAPNFIIFEMAQKDVLGELLYRIHQLSGSCVGAGSWQANMNARVCDVAYRGENEEVIYSFPWAPYGVGRKIAGMRGPGEGSFGSAQAKAVQAEHFGHIRMDDPRLPKPNIKNGWISWSKQVEIKWSFPSNWPINIRELQPDAAKYAAEDVTQINSVADLDQAIIQGRGVTIASMLGFKNPQVKHGALVAEWDTEWAHQMSISGRWQHPQLGLLFKDDNQWNDVHGRCPKLSEYGVNGSVWLKESTMDKVLKARDTECYAHSSIGDFETREFKWKPITADDIMGG